MTEEGLSLAVNKIKVSIRTPKDEKGAENKKGTKERGKGKRGVSAPLERSFQITSRDLGDSLRTVENRKEMMGRPAGEIPIPWKIRTKPMKFANIPKRYGAKPVLVAEMEDKAFEEQRGELMSAGSRLRTFKMGVPGWVKANAYMQQYTNERVNTALGQGKVEANVGQGEGGAKLGTLVGDTAAAAAAMAAASATQPFQALDDMLPQEEVDGGLLFIGMEKLDMEKSNGRERIQVDTMGHGLNPVDGPFNKNDFDRNHNINNNINEEMVNTLDILATLSSPVERDFPLVDPGSQESSCTDSVSFADDYIKSLESKKKAQIKVVAPTTPIELSASLRADRGDGGGDLRELITFSASASQTSVASASRNSKEDAAMRTRLLRRSSTAKEKEMKQSSISIKDPDNVSLDQFVLLEPAPTSASSHAGSIHDEPMYSPDKVLKEHREKEALKVKRVRVTNTNISSPGSSVVGEDFEEELKSPPPSRSFRSQRDRHPPSFEDFFEKDPKPTSVTVATINDRDGVFMDERGEIREVSKSSRELDAYEMYNIEFNNERESISGAGVSSMEQSLSESETMSLFMSQSQQSQQYQQGLFQQNPNSGQTFSKLPILARVANVTRRMDETKRQEILRRITAQALEKTSFISRKKGTAPTLRVGTAPIYQTERKPRWPKILTPAELKEVQDKVEARPLDPGSDGAVMPLSDILDELEVLPVPETTLSDAPAPSLTVTSLVDAIDIQAKSIDAGIAPHDETTKKSVRHAARAPAFYKLSKIKEPLTGIMYEYYPDYSAKSSGSQESQQFLVPRLMEVHGGVPVVITNKQSKS